MKLTKYMLVATAALAVASCSKWTEPERKTFPGQGNIERIIPTSLGMQALIGTL